MSSEFISNIANVDYSLLGLVNKMPLEDMESFEVKEDGKFKATFKEEHTAKLGHDNPAWKKAFEGMTLKVSKTVTGVFKPQEKSIRFDQKCVVAQTAIADISLREVKVEGEMLKIAGKWGILPEKQAAVKADDVMFTKVNWN